MTDTFCMSRRSAILGAATMSLFATAASPVEAQIDPLRVVADPDALVLGNPNGNLKIAVYFDYQCPVCKRVEPDLMRLVRADGQIGLVMKDWPIFGELSIQMARMVWSSRLQGKSAEFHDMLMAIRGRPDPAQLDLLASKVGIDIGLSGRRPIDRECLLCLVGTVGTRTFSSKNLSQFTSNFGRSSAGSKDQLSIGGPAAAAGRERCRRSRYSFRANPL